jgi:hypothetical protein
LVEETARGRARNHSKKSGGVTSERVKMPRTVLLAVAAIASGAIAATMAVDEPNDSPAHHHPDVRTLFALYDSDKDGVRWSSIQLQIRKMHSIDRSSPLSQLSSTA